MVVAALVAAPSARVAAVFTNGSVVAPCDSPIYCYGDMLREVELAQPFSDSKTFVNMPAIKPLADIQSAFDQLAKPLRNDSALHAFLDANFGRAGAELEEVPRDQLKTDAVFLERINDTVVREFVAKVIDIWPDLTRTQVDASSSSSSSSGSFIPVRLRPFVIAGGRFREPYYWDSYWILEGLLRTRGSFTQIARNTIENLLDMLDQLGIIPNGARIYYLNRSQPPMLAQMVRLYLEQTGDDTVLDRALPLLEREHAFWLSQRSVNVTLNGTTHSLSRYAVENNQPRPESYREDFDTASHLAGPHRASQQASLYADLATAAESGWDFSSRWLAQAGGGDSSNSRGRRGPDEFPLRGLDSRAVVPVCLNSILYANERTLSALFARRGNAEAADAWRGRAARRRAAMTAVLWNETHFSYFDYNLTAGRQNVFAPAGGAHADADALDTAGAPPGQLVVFHAAQLFPFWTRAAPPRLRAPAAVARAYARVARYLDRGAGGIPATNLRSGQQWDRPNVWPPLMHILIQGLLNAVDDAGEDDHADLRLRTPHSHAAVGPPPPPPHAAASVISSPAAGPRSPPDARPVADPTQLRRGLRALAVRLAQRYLDTTFCTWHATDGSTSATPRLPGIADAATGIMFEKYADNTTALAGGGGEYEVVEGFGWTNGVLIWAADTFAADLRGPQCPDNAAVAAASVVRRSALHLHAWDARYVKPFGRRARR